MNAIVSDKTLSPNGAQEPAEREVLLRKDFIQANMAYRESQM